jgi:hypothetical protein
VLPLSRDGNKLTMEDGILLSVGQVHDNPVILPSAQQDGILPAVGQVHDEGLKRLSTWCRMGSIVIPPRAGIHGRVRSMVVASQDPG